MVQVGQSQHPSAAFLVDPPELAADVGHIGVGEDAGVALLERASGLLRGMIREYKDIPARIEDSLFMVLLPGTVREESVNLAIRLFIAFREQEAPPVPVSIGIVQIERTWGTEKLLRTAKIAAGKAAELPSPSLSLYDGKTNSYQTLSEVYNSD